MMRPFTLLCLIAALGSGFYLFQTKNQAMLLDRDITRVMKQTDAVRQRAGLMRTEYALLNDPSRLAELSGGLLPDLKTTAPTQFTSFTELERRLPAIGAPMPPQPEPKSPNAVVPKLVQTKAEPLRQEPPRVDTAKADAAKADRAMPSAAVAPRVAVTTVALAMPPVATPAPVATASVPVAPNQSVSGQVVAAPPRPPLSLAAPIAAPSPAAARPPTPVAAPVAAPVPPATGRSLLAASQPVLPPRLSPAPLPPPATPAEAVARIARGEPVNPAIPAVASALGMARTMVPATISTAQAGTLR